MIKIRNVISPASAVILIQVPKQGISPDIFSILSDMTERTVSQLVIIQESTKNGQLQEEIVLPDYICSPDGFRCIWLRGNITKIPGFIFKQKKSEFPCIKWDVR